MSGLGDCSGAQPGHLGASALTEVKKARGVCWELTADG